MRGFLGWLLLVAILGGIAFVLAPLVVRPLVVEGVRAASPFGSERLDVEVSLDTLNLLRGEVDGVHLTGSNLETSEATIGSLDLTLTDLSIADHAFASIVGSLRSVVMRRPDGTSIDVDRIDLSGPSQAVDLTASVTRDAALTLVRGALADSGLPVDRVELIDGGVRLEVLGQPSDVAIGVVDGSVTMAGALAGGAIVLFGPAVGDAWDITGISASPYGLRVQAVANLDEAFLSSR
jgi:hypothetical protein